MPRILLVDDEAFAMRYYLAVLQLKGHDVVYERDVDSALHRISEMSEKFDVIIVDIMMPYGNAFNTMKLDQGIATAGLYLYKSFRKTLPDVPIIILTNYRDERKVGALGPDERLKCLVKEDYPPVQLEVAIRDLLTRTQ